MDLLSFSSYKELEKNYIVIHLIVPANLKKLSK